VQSAAEQRGGIHGYQAVRSRTARHGEDFAIEIFVLLVACRFERKIFVNAIAFLGAGGHSWSPDHIIADG